MPKIHHVDTKPAFHAAVAAATSGDTILLAPGVYDWLEVRGRVHETPVTIRSANPDDPAVISRLRLNESSGIIIEDIVFDRNPAVVTDTFHDLISMVGAHNVTIRDNVFHGSVVNDGSASNGKIVNIGIYGAGVSNITVERNEFDGTHRGVLFSGIQNSTIANNYIHDYFEDAIHLAYANGVNISKNIMTNPIRFSDEHLDFIQIREISNTVIDSNLMLQGTGDPSQGIFIGKISSGDKYNGNVEITNNVVHTGMHNAIYIKDMQDTAIRNNVVLTPDNKFHIAHIQIRGAWTKNIDVTGNVASGYDDTILQVARSGGVFTDNYWVQRDNPNADKFVNTVVRNGLADAFARLEDFLPTETFIRQSGGRAGIDGTAFSHMDAWMGFTPPPAEALTSLDLSSFAIEPHLPGVQDFGAHAVAEDGSLRLIGNAWKVIPIGLNVTADTVLGVTLRADAPGEIYGVGLLRNGQVLPGEALRLAGGQDWGVAIDGALAQPGQTVEAVLELGRYARGAFDGLVLIADDDAAAAADITFIDIRLDAASILTPPPTRALVDVSAAAGDLTGFLDGAQNFGTVTQQDGAFVLDGNAWKALWQPFKIEAGVTLEVTIETSDPGEIVGVALLSGGDFAKETLFQLAGSQSYGVQNYRVDDAAATAGPRKVAIDLSAFADGWVDGLVFIADDDLDASGMARFSSAAITDSGRDAPAVPAPAKLVLATDELRSFSRFQDFGYGKAIDGGRGVEVGGNGWKAVDLDMMVTADTVVTLEFRAPKLGEIHGVAFENDDIQSAERTFALAGTQEWGIRDHHVDGPADAWRSVTLKVGEHFTGAVDRIVFIADSDEGHLGVSQFRNVVVHDTALYYDL